jgi:hypothetical protein
VKAKIIIIINIIMIIVNIIIIINVGTYEIVTARRVRRPS